MAVRDIHIHLRIEVEPDPRVGEVLRLLHTILGKETTIMADLTSLTAAVERAVTVEESAITLIQGIAAELAAAKNDPAAVQALADKLNTGADALSSAVTANTPAAPTP